jgi:hypothetical protein
MADERDWKHFAKMSNEELNPALRQTNVGGSFCFGQLLRVVHEKDPQATHCIQYSDYEDNQWTVECLLLPHRIDKIENDNSIRKVFIKFSNGISLVVAR